MREITTKEETRIVKTNSTKYFCDICKKQIKSDPYDIENVTIEAETGYSYPDDTSVTTIEFDVCLNCFNEKLRPFIESFGATPTIT